MKHNFSKVPKVEFVFWLPTRDRDILRQLAFKEGVSMAEYLRNMIEARIEQEREEAFLLCQKMT